jgi:two-component system nitrate/nitrite response regulator NarL
VDATPVFIVTAVTLYRDGLTLALHGTPGLRVCGAAAGPFEFGSALATAERPVLLLDVATVAGPQAVGEIQQAYPRVRVMALGLAEITTEIVTWIEAGAAGYLTREQSLGELVAAIASLARDEVACPPQVAAALMRRVATLAAERRRVWANDLLSPRELEVVTLIDRGLSNKQIAAQLFITLATVKNHVHKILEKLDVHARAEAAAYLRGRYVAQG